MPSDTEPARTDRNRARRGAATLAPLALVALGVSASAAAQDPPGAIVQPLPPREAEDLNAAMRKLASDPTDLDALLSAGEAAIALGDVDAATGFFSRAQQVSQGNGRVRLGLARVFLANRRPVEALRLFAEAEQSGIPQARMAPYRGLAFDLVGDNASAQELYRLALQHEDDPEVRRRLAISLAISGNRDAFEKVLYPLLAENDRAAYRARAFGLAILGDQDEAVSIVETMMPSDLALRMTPYLRYMSRLTKAQQAAAANLGAFPRAAEIGHDEPGIAGYDRGASSLVKGADSALAPSGEPMGPRKAAPKTAGSDTGERSRTTKPEKRGGGEKVAAQTLQRSAGELPPKELPAQSQAPAQPAASTPAASPPPSSPPASSPPPKAVVVASGGETQGPELREGGGRGSPPVSAASPSEKPEPASVADAFADLGPSPASSGTARSGAVDIASIKPPREVEKPKPVKPKIPARHWVQIATGKDLGALKFDWRRIARKADGKIDGKGPFATPWGEANRLLAGPYDSEADAREMVNQLKALGIDSFPFSSAEGEEIKPLD